MLNRRKRLPEIPAAQPGFDVRHRQAAIERTQRATKSSGGVALHHHQVRRFFHQHRVERRHNARRRFSQRLSRPHHVQIIVRSDRERLQGLIQQAAVLRRHNDAGLEFVGTSKNRRATGASLIASGRVPRTIAIFKEWISSVPDQVR